MSEGGNAGECRAKGSPRHGARGPVIEGGIGDRTERLRPAGTAHQVCVRIALFAFHPTLIEESNPHS